MNKKLSANQVIKNRLSPKENAYVASLILFCVTAAITFMSVMNNIHIISYYPSQTQSYRTVALWVIFTGIMFVLNRWLGKHIVREWDATHLPEKS